MAMGALKRAPVFVPLRAPLFCGDPAMVVTTQLVPAATIFRITWLPVSATKSFPAGSTAIPEGWLKRAKLLDASAQPGVNADPAIVVTTQFVPEGTTFRIK